VLSCSTSCCEPDLTRCSLSPQDMNSVAARALANLLLPSNHRPPSPPGSHPTSATTPTGRTPSPGPGASRDPRVGQRSSPPLRTEGASPSSQQQQREGRIAPSQPMASSSVRLLPDIVQHMCCHPHYRLLSLRSIPQVWRRVRRDTSCLAFAHRKRSVFARGRLS